jgi:hypothetical protein
MPAAELRTSGKYKMAAADMNGRALRAHSHGEFDRRQTCYEIEEESSEIVPKALHLPLHSSLHVDSVSCDQLRIRHFGTERELLEPSLSFWLGEKCQQVLAGQPVS